jgi:hypothetical protein
MARSSAHHPAVTPRRPMMVPMVTFSSFEALTRKVKSEFAALGVEDWTGRGGV